MQCKQKELLKELSVGYDAIETLKKDRKDRDIVITELEKQIMIAREAAVSLNTAHNDNRIRLDMKAKNFTFSNNTNWR